MGLFVKKKKEIKNQTTFEEYLANFLAGKLEVSNTETAQMKLSAVYRCIDVLSDSIGRLPWRIVDTNTNIIPKDNWVKWTKYLLNIHPNKNMTSFAYHKLMEINRLMAGNAYAEIVTNHNGSIVGLVPINPNQVKIEEHSDGDIVYIVTEKSGDKRTLLQDEMIHLKGISFNGIEGQSVLSHARLTTQNALLQEEYQRRFYVRGGRPSGTLETESDLGKVARGPDGKLDPSGKSAREIIRAEWEKANSGMENINRVAVLDNGFKYNAIAQISHVDMAFIESKEVSIADIARFFGVPLYKLFAGKESYASNEQNNISFVVDKLDPIVTQYEQEDTLKLLSFEQKLNGFSIKANLNSLLRGDTAARATWYDKMSKIAYTPNEIRRLEDMADVDGGDVVMASLNYIPLDLFRELSILRANNNKLESQKNKEENE